MRSRVAYCVLTMIKFAFYNDNFCTIQFNKFNLKIKRQRSHRLSGHLLQVALSLPTQTARDLETCSEVAENCCTLSQGVLGSQLLCEITGVNLNFKSPIAFISLLEPLL